MAACQPFSPPASDDSCRDDTFRFDADAAAVLHQTNSNLRHRLRQQRALNGKYNALKEKTGAMHAELAALKQHHDAAIATFSEINAAKNAKIDGLEREAARLRETNAALRRRVDSDELVRLKHDYMDLLRSRNQLVMYVRLLRKEAGHVNGVAVQPFATLLLPKEDHRRTKKQQQLAAEEEAALIAQQKKDREDFMDVYDKALREEQASVCDVCRKNRYEAVLTIDDFEAARRCPISVRRQRQIDERLDSYASWHEFSAMCGAPLLRTLGLPEWLQEAEASTSMFMT